MSTYVFKQKKGPLNVEVSHMSSKKQAIENFSGLLPSDVSIDDFDVFKKTPCPYCNKPFKKWTDGYWDNCQWQINKYEDNGAQHYELLGQIITDELSQMAALTKLRYCPMCGRPLNEKEE